MARCGTCVHSAELPDERFVCNRYQDDARVARWWQACCFYMREIGAEGDDD